VQTARRVRRPARGTVDAVDTVYGKHSVRAVLLARPESVTRLLLGGKEAYHRDLIELARSAGVTPELVAWPEFRRTTSTRAPP
jgi:RNA 2'-O ribose methyltransferase substrate binding